MIRRIEALNFRCFRHVAQPLENFQVLAGPNASGKSTFLDVVAFLGDLLNGDLDFAVRKRSQNFQDLVWNRSGERFELAVELEIPPERRNQIAKASYSIVRYEVAVGIDADTEELAIFAEKVVLKEAKGSQPEQLLIFPQEPSAPSSIISPARSKDTRTIVNKVFQGNDNFYSEVHQKGGKGWLPSFKLGPRKSALKNLPADESIFPVSTWLKDLLTEGVQKIALNSLSMRQPSSPGQGKAFKPDGSNIAWVIADLVKTSNERFRDWIDHLRTALHDIKSIRTVERPEDRHRYIIIEYEDGLEVPSWMASDGTLRLLALTLPAYLPEFTGVYLIEEPENGLHPRAVQTAFQSLASVKGAQILLTTHSPIILSTANPEQILCCSKTKNGAVDIIPGVDHPNLQAWKEKTDLAVLFAEGILG